MTQNVRYLPIPLDIGEAPIPVGMSDSDFDLLLETLQLWKKKIVRSEYPRAAIWRNKDHDKPVTITGVMGEKDGERYYQSSEGTGIPASELDFKLNGLLVAGGRLVPVAQGCFDNTPIVKRWTL